MEYVRRVDFGKFEAAPNDRLSVSSQGNQWPVPSSSRTVNVIA